MTMVTFSLLPTWSQTGQFYCQSTVQASLTSATAAHCLDTCSLEHTVLEHCVSLAFTYLHTQYSAVQDAWTLTSMNTLYFVFLWDKLLLTGTLLFMVDSDIFEHPVLCCVWWHNISGEGLLLAACKGVLSWKRWKMPLNCTRFNETHISALQLPGCLPAPSLSQNCGRGGGRGRDKVKTHGVLVIIWKPFHDHLSCLKYSTRNSA